VIAFVVIAVLMVAGALLAVLPALLAKRGAETSERAAANLSLLRRELDDNDAELRAGSIDRDQWEKTRREIERRAIEESREGDAGAPLAVSNARSPWVASAVAVVLPLAAVSLYILLGEPQAITGKAQGDDEQMAHAVQRDKIEEMVTRLADRLKAAPEDAEGWAMLGRSYAYLGKFNEAMNAYEEAMKRGTPDARLLADYADIYATTKGGGSLNKRALALDPDQPKALALAGTIAFQKEDFAAAVRHWERFVAVVPQDSPFAGQIASGLAEAREALARTNPAAAKALAARTETAKAEPAAAGVSISGTVTLSPTLAQRAAAGDTLFVFAHAPGAGGPPLAVLRTTVGELPLKFTLDDSMSMSPQFKLSSAPKVIVTARVSKSGAAVPQPGDLEGVSAPVAPGATGIAIRIDKERKA